MALIGQLTGNLGRDPELRYFENGTSVASFSVAARQAKVKGEDPPALWVKVELWGKSAQYAADYLKKGDHVFCTGDLRQEEFTRRDGSPGVALVLKNARVEKFGGGQQQGQPAAAPAATSYAQASQPARLRSRGAV